MPEETTTGHALRLAREEWTKPYRDALAEVKEALAVIADDALDGETAERIDSVRARISDVLAVPDTSRSNHAA